MGVHAAVECTQWSRTFRAHFLTDGDRFGNWAPIEEAIGLPAGHLQAYGICQVRGVKRVDCDCMPYRSIVVTMTVWGWWHWPAVVRTTMAVMNGWAGNNTCPELLVSPHIFGDRLMFSLEHARESAVTEFIGGEFGRRCARDAMMLLGVKSTAWHYDSLICSLARSAERLTVELLVMAVIRDAFMLYEWKRAEQVGND